MSDSQLAARLVETPHPRSAFKEQVLSAAIESGYLGHGAVLSSFVDVGGVVRTIESLKAAFGENFRHTFAAKANTMSKALDLVRTQGLGCEVASVGELAQARKVGFEPSSIVYDEPAKTEQIINRTLLDGVSLNIDNFEEFARVKSTMQHVLSKSRVGFRINPQVGAGSIGAMSTATKSSKFGVALDDSDNRQRLIEVYRSNPWLTSIHTHIGSQGCTLDLMVAGIRKVVDLVEEINAQTPTQRIQIIDIGGGLPVNFESEEIKPTFEEYADALRMQVPELFSGKYIVKTEFGRSIYAKNGFIAARVEYTKESGGKQIAITHAGAQIAARTAFMPDLWAIRLSVFDSDGHEKVGNEVVQDVAGPCCFAGDMLGRDRLLPLIESGDYVMLHDTGAYYFSNPFYYNSLPASAVYGARVSATGSIEFDVWREQQSIDEMLAVLG